VNAVLHWVGVALYLYWFVLIARLVMEWTLQLTSYRPSGAGAVAFEFVYTVTDPPLRLLRRFIPLLRIGRFALDVSFLVLLLGVNIVAGQLMVQR
jgi:YggT family protein